MALGSTNSALIVMFIFVLFPFSLSSFFLLYKKQCNKKNRCKMGKRERDREMTFIMSGHGYDMSCM